MEFEEIINLNIDIRSITHRLKKNNLYQDLIDITNFLPNTSLPKERIFCFKNKIKQRVRCICGNYTNFYSQKGYAKYCSIKCSANSPEFTSVRKETCLKKYGTEHHMKSKEFMEEFKQMNIDKFGVDNISKLESVKRKKKETFQKNYGMDHMFCSNEMKHKYMMDKYGVKHNTEMESVLEKMKETGVKNGNYISDEFRSEFDIYRRKVNNITARVKENLFENWDGMDYYDNEPIRVISDHNDPATIDHKISIQYGFLNKIDPLIIGDIDNLCITKRSINSSKNKLTEIQFIEKLNLSR